MAAIITVHGTNATGPEEGERWWQKGSEFESEVRRFVAGENGEEPSFQPFVWDGRNSEVSRRAAGDRLFQKLATLETQDTAYCMVGHSHGGSVINSALLCSAQKGNPLNRLGAWITVGTPFVRTANTLLSLFWEWLSRISLTGKMALYAFLVLASSLLSGILWGAILMTGLVSSMEKPELNLYYLFVPLSFSALISFLTIALVIGFRRRAISRLYNYQRRCEWNFSNKWVSFLHRNDEAATGLKMLQHANFRIFDTGLISFVLWLFSWVFILLWILLGLIISYYYLEVWPFPSTRGYLHLVILIFAASLGWMLIGFCAIALVQVLAPRLARMLAPIFDRITWTQIRLAGLGGDIAYERFLDVELHPVWAPGPFPTLPNELTTEISQFSDREAAASISKLRRAVSLLAFAEGNENKTDLVADYLTWDELIHTAYFRVPRFRKLVIYAISCAPGFRAAEQFRNDPDYQLVEGWYKEITAKPNG